MGIFDLFEPDVEKLKSKKDVKGLIKALTYEKKMYVLKISCFFKKSSYDMDLAYIKEMDIRMRAAEALGEIGDERAVEPLIQALKDENSWVRQSATEALGKIGDKRAVEPLIQALKDKYVRSEAAEALGEIGDKRAVEPLIQFLKDDHGRVENDKAAEALGKIGDKRAAEAVMSYLFGNIYHTIIRDEIHRETIENLFCGYSDLIIRASTYRRNIHVVADEREIYNYIPNFTAIETLRKIHTPISNNILHQITQLRDIQVSFAYNCVDDNYGTLSFEQHRNMAKEELKLRGNPPYDPSAYLDDKAWKL